MPHVDIARSPALAAVVPFYVGAAVAFLALTVLLFFSAEAFTGHYFHPKLLALVHLAALGWGTMIIFGAAYQLLPVIFENPLHSERLATASFAALAPGVALMAYGFWKFRPDSGMLLGAGLVLLATFMFMWNVVLTAGDSPKYSHQKRFLLAASIWLVFTAVVGFLLVWNFTRPVFDRDHLVVLRLHAHMGLAGWFLLLIFGVASKLLPMFLLGKSARDGWLRFSFYAVNTGLVLFLVDGWFYGLSARTPFYLAIVVAGIAGFLAYIYDVFRHRMRRTIDVPMRQAILSLALLVPAVGLAAAIAFDPARHRLAIAYGIVLFMGWITSIILGQTFKTLPFIIWNSRYKQFAGRPKLPMPRDLLYETWLAPQGWIYLAAFAMLITGAIIANLLLIKIAAGLFVIVASMYLINVIHIVFHKTLVKP